MCVDNKFSKDVVLYRGKNAVYKFLKAIFICNVVSSEKGFIEYTENCLVINDKQTVKLGKCSISFKNYFKQLPAPFKIYAGFECISSATS